MRKVKLAMASILTAAVVALGAADFGDNRADAKVMRHTEGDLEWNYTIDDSINNSDATDVYLGNISTISSDITIPSSFTDEYGTHTVKSIGHSGVNGTDSFFFGCEFSSKVIIDIDASGCIGLERINGYAFYEKTRIDKIMLPKTVSSIGENICVSCADTTIYTENPNISFEGSYDGKVRFNAPSKSTALDFVGAARYASNGTVTYRVDFDKVENGAEIASAPLKTYAYAGTDREVAMLKAVPNLPWHEFDGYYTQKNGKGTKYYDGEGKLLQNVAADMTLYANYVPNKFAISYVGASSSEIADAPKKYTYGEGINTLYHPTRKGYTFLGWFDNEKFSGNPITRIHNGEHGDKVLYAKWDANSYRVRFVCPDGVVGSMGDQIIRYGEKTLLNDVKYMKEGYVFYQWNTKEDGTGTGYGNQQEVLNLAADMDSVITLYPIFRASHTMPISVSVIYKALPGEEDEVVTDTLYGTTGEEMDIDPSPYAKTGFVTPGHCLLVVDANEKVNRAEFVFKREDCKVSFSKSRGVKRVEGVGNYPYGQTVTLKAVPEEGYAVTGCKVVNGSGKGTEASGEKISVQVFEDTEIAVETEGIHYGIFYELNGGAFRSEDYVKEYVHGKETVLPDNVSKKGFRFAGWYDEDGRKVEKIGSEEIGEKVFYAKYGDGIYNIQYHTDGGTLNGDYAKTYKWNVGAVLPTKENISKDGYSFLGWWDGKSVVSKITTTDSDDIDLMALWQDNSKTTMILKDGVEFKGGINVEAKKVSLSTATEKNTGFYYKQLKGIEKQLYHTLYNAYKFTPAERKIKYTGSLEVSSMDKITVANGYSAFNAMILDHPEIFWLAEFSVGAVGENAIYFSPVEAYKGFDEDATKYDGYFKTAISAIGVSNKDTSYTVIKKINDYIVKVYSYNEYGFTLNKKTSDDTRSIGRMLAYKEGCCVGYAKLTKAFCDYYGIECILVRSSNHMWNQVRIDGNWYALDVTWNDEGNKSFYDWFLKGKKTTIQNDSKNTHEVIKYHYIDENDKPITEFAYFNVPTLSSADYKAPASNTAALPAKNAIKTVGSLKYKVTKSAAKNGTVSVSGTKNKKISKATVPATVKINGYAFKVTAVGAKAFSGCKKLKSVTIGKNVATIGSKAFYRAKALKKITVKGKGLKKIGKSALKGIGKKAVIKVPKAKKKAYKKLMGKKAGFSKTMKLK